MIWPVSWPGPSPAEPVSSAGCTSGWRPRHSGTASWIAFLERGGLQFGQPEVEQLDALLGHQNVGRFQVAMRDAFLMRGVQSIQNLSRVFQGFFERQRSPQRRALDELHHQVVGTDVVKLADIGMVQGRDGACLALEALIEPALGNLDRDGAIHPRVDRFVHLSPAAGAHGCQDLIGPQSSSGSQRHGVSNDFSARKLAKRGLSSDHGYPEIGLAGVKLTRNARLVDMFARCWSTPATRSQARRNGDAALR